MIYPWRKSLIKKMSNQLLDINRVLNLLQDKIAEIEKRSVFTSDSIRDPLSNLNMKLLSIKTSSCQPFWKQQELALNIMSMLIPTIKTSLTRLGSTADGGYFVPSEILSSGNIAVNIGVGSEISLDLDLRQRGFSLFAFDPYIDEYPLEGANTKFVKKGLNTKNSEKNITLREIVDSYIGDRSKNSFLFIDIEGSESETLASYEEVDSIKDFAIVVVEFHNLLEVITSKDTRKYDALIKSLENLDKYFDICYISGNNCSEYLAFDSRIFPDVAEVTFVNKELKFSETNSTTRYQSANDINLPPLDLTNWQR
jgi:hypothetical protein